MRYWRRNGLMRTAQRIVQEVWLPLERPAPALYRRDCDQVMAQRAPALVLSCSEPRAQVARFVRHAQSLCIPVVACVEHADVQLLAWCDVVVTCNASLARETRAPAPDWLVLREGYAPAEMAAAIEAWLPEYRQRLRPKISLVAPLYNKARELPAVLASYFAQSYAGEVEFIFVDDCSPDDSAGVVQRAFAREGRACRVLRHARNLGNCAARNRGVAEATGELVVVVDADCVLNRTFLQRHAEAHSFGDCDVVIGPLNLESGAREPLAYAAALESRPKMVAARAQPQDALNPASFLNCVTRNFSIRRAFIDGPLFDPAFSYSADPQSGFGWEDVEMGYRLYRRGARIKHVPDAFSVHISHPPSVPEAEKPARSQRNFQRLLARHPDLQLEARRWVGVTGERIRKWGSVKGISKKKLRILTYRWHCAHQYELYKLPHEFHLVSGLGSPMTQRWDYACRPLPPNAGFRPLRAVRMADYDLALLHFDENVLSPEHCNGVIGPDWGAAFRWFMENVRLPKIAVCHGTPQFRGQYDFDYAGADLMQVIEPARTKLVDYLGDTHVVCNSHQAQQEWGFRRSSVIWHGFDPTEFPPSTRERGILTPTGPLVRSRPHYRGYFLQQQVLAGFPPEHAPAALEVPDPSPLYEGNAYAAWKFRNYVDALRRFSVYFNPTLRSPMPRARGEAMLCGAATVSAQNHDVDLFVENGVNGFYASEPGELREQLLFLCRHPAAAAKIGDAGRRTALDLFNHDRFLDDWTRLIGQVL
jgi:glycosyltransferase involved in cell wall biosynthesis